MILSGCISTLQKHKLHKFEVACLANLAPADADEAKALLPRQVYTLFTQWYSLKVHILNFVWRNNKKSS